MLNSITKDGEETRTTKASFIVVSLKEMGVTPLTRLS